MMSKEEKKDMDVIPFIKSFPVYNVAQTNRQKYTGDDEKLMEKLKVSGFGIRKVCTPMH